MSTKQCGQCGEILVKQSLNTDGTVLNASLKLEYDKYIDNYNRMLECSECGGLCYHSKKTTNPPPMMDTDYVKNAVVIKESHQKMKKNYSKMKIEKNLICLILKFGRVLFMEHMIDLRKNL